ncbi:hypothetical protein AAVH_06774, partial [Aphelenchoides avenae]
VCADFPRTKATCACLLAATVLSFVAILARPANTDLGHGGGVCGAIFPANTVALLVSTHKRCLDLARKAAFAV